MEETANQTVSSGTALCAICQSKFQEGEAKIACPACHAAYHAECWTENGGCAVYGCAEVPKTEGRSAIEVPVGYWGQEHKPCPVCSQMILAAAVRCRHCGSIFQTAKPLGSDEFSRSAAINARKPAVQKKAVWCAALCLFPFTAMIAVPVTFFWSRSRREELNELPSLFPALVKIGLLVGLVEVIALVLVVFFYSSHLR